jgi:hypothetical protein
LNANDYELSPTGTIYRIDEGGRALMGAYTDRKIVVDFTLHPRGLCILEIIPDKP